MDAGASADDLHVVIGAALSFTSWRLNSPWTRGDTALHAAAWTTARLLGEAWVPRPRDASRSAEWSSTEREAVRWGLTRFAFLLNCGIGPRTARREAVTIPLEASGVHSPELGRRVSVKPPGHRNQNDDLVPGTTPVWARTSTEFRSQRLVARRILNVGPDGHWHDGWLVVPSDLAADHAWQVVTEA